MPVDYFLQILKTTFFWKKIRFEKSKEDFVAKRRKVLKKGDFASYKVFVQSMFESEQMVYQEILQDMFNKLGISEQIFDNSF